VDSTTVDLKVDVNDKASQALNSLAESIKRVTAAEKQVITETQRLAQSQAAFAQQKADEARRRKEEADANKKPPPTVRQEAEDRVKKAERNKAVEAEVARMSRTRADKAASLAGGASRLAGGGITSLVGRGGPAGVAVAAGVMALDAAAQKGADALNVVNNGMLTQAQKESALRDQFIPLHESFRKFREALDGTTEAVARSKRDLDRNLAFGNINQQAMEAARGVEFPVQQASDLSRAYNRAPAPAGQETFDRGTAIGERRAADQATRLAALDAKRQADAEAAGAKATAADQLDKVKAAQGNLTVTQTNRDKALAAWRAQQAAENSGAPVDKAKRAQLYTDATTASDQVVKSAERAEAELTRYKEAGLKAVEAEKRAREASVNVARAELELLSQREQRMSSMAERVGAMHESEFEQAKEAVREIRAGGLTSVTPDRANLAATIAPELVAKERQKLGAERYAGFAAEQKGADDSNIEDFNKATLKEVRAQVDKIKADVRVQVNLDPQHVAESITAKLSKVMTDFKVALDVKVQALEDLFRLNQTQQFQANK